MTKPKKPTPGETATVLEAIRAGSPYRQAVLAAGFSWEVGRDLWADPEWRAAVTKMRSAFETESLQAIADAGKEDWKAKAWLLERIKKDRYGQKVQQEVNVNVKGIPFRSVVDGRVFDAEIEATKALPEGDESAAIQPSKKAKKEAV